MFYLKALGHLVGMALVLVLVARAGLPAGGNALIGVALIVWAIWLIARIVGRITRSS